MKTFLWTIHLALFSIAVSREPQTDRVTYPEKIEKARLGQKSFETVRNLHINWYSYALKALIAQLGKELYKHLNENERKMLAECLLQVDEKYSLRGGAKCLVKIRKKAKAARPNRGCGDPTTDHIFCDDIDSSFLIELESEEVTLNPTDGTTVAAKQDSSTVNETNSNVTTAVPTTVSNSDIPQYREPYLETQKTKLSEVETKDSTSYGISTTSSSNEETHWLMTSDMRPSSFATALPKIKADVQYGKAAKTVLQEVPTAKIMPFKYRDEDNDQKSVNNNNALAALSKSERKTTETRINGNNSKNYSETFSNTTTEIKFNRNQLLMTNTNNDASRNTQTLRRVKIPFQKSLTLFNAQYSRLTELPFINCTLRSTDKTSFRGTSECSVSSRLALFAKYLEQMHDGIKRPKIFYNKATKRVKRSSESFSLSDKNLNTKISHGLKVKKMKSLDSLSPPAQDTSFQKVANLILLTLHGDKKGSDKWYDDYQKLLKYKKQFDERKKLPAAKVYQRHLYDIVIEDDILDVNKNEKSNVPNFLKSADSIVRRFGHRKGMEKSNFRFLSPRIASLLPDKMASGSKILSPSILSFYEDNSPDNIASLPKILETAGLNEQERNSMIKILMDISGAKTAIDSGLELIKSLNISGLTGEIFDATKRFGKAFDELKASFTHHQKNDINNHGFTFVETQQYGQVLNKYGVKDVEDVHFDVDSYKKLSKKQKHIKLWKSIEKIARGKTAKRHKRQVNLFPYKVLSPFIFEPAFGLSILGPIILSPNIFSPLILNPAILSPNILSPSAFAPLILSPFLLTPWILSPVFAGPLILSPYCLSPNILQPFVMAPLILSPNFLCPDILSPQTLGGPVLSPSAYSPAVLTETYMMVSFLSPTYMS